MYLLIRNPIPRGSAWLNPPGSGFPINVLSLRFINELDQGKGARVYPAIQILGDVIQGVIAQVLEKTPCRDAL